MPAFREDAAGVHFVVVLDPVFVAHPPGAIFAELVVEFVFEAAVLVPLFVFVSEGAFPLASTPEVADEFEDFGFADARDSVRVVVSMPSAPIFRGVLQKT